MDCLNYNAVLPSLKKKNIIAFGKMGFASYSLLAYKYARSQF